jgi:Dynamin family
MSTDISPAASEVMSAWHSRRPGFALMGEYSSGKSELLNLLVGRRLLPTKVTATDLPAVWLTYGATEKVAGLAYDGSLHDLSLQDLATDRAMTFVAIRVETDAAILKETDIIDTPGISDPRMSTAIVEEIARFCDFVVWCSPANQAWRQTERAFWNTTRAQLKNNSILVVTRADKLRSLEDLEKVLRRCRSEAANHFSAIVSVATLAAMAAQETPRSARGREAWVASGAEQLLLHLRQSIKAAIEDCAARQKYSPKAETAKKKPPKQTKKPAAPADRPSCLAEIMSTIAQLKGDATHFSKNDQILDIISHLSGKILLDKELTEEHRNVLSRSLSVNTAFAVNISRIVEQVEHEVADFAEGAWCELGR